MNSPTPAQDSVPPLNRDVAYWAMTATQFFGAFNDNLFKQLLLLLCVDLTLLKGPDYDMQFFAAAIFAVPFVLFSGVSGMLADRISKRSIIVFCKMLEIIVMLLAMLVFMVASDLSNLLKLQFVVLFLMSTQSAIFGPAKYGILPELFREDDLPSANGMIQMTTFVAIIFGMSLAGFAKDWFGAVKPGEPDRIWIAFLLCAGVAVIGTVTSFFVRRTPIADPDLKFEKSDLFIGREMRDALRSDRALFRVLIVSSLFWLVGVIVQTSVNEIGKGHLSLNNTRTSFLAACMGLGIAIGCVLAGKLSDHWRPNSLVKIGAWGLVISLLLVCLFPRQQNLVPTSFVTGVPQRESFWAMLIPASTVEFFARVVLTLLGIAAGLFVVPLQVFLQSRPPENLKGRMIGAMNFVNWLAIVGGSVLGGVIFKLLKANGLALTWTFVVPALILLPVAAYYRLPEDATNTDSQTENPTPDA